MITFLMNNISYMSFIGTVTAVIILLIIKIRIALKRDYCIDDKDVVEVFEKCKNKIEINKNIELLASKSIGTPSVYAFIYPKILIPESLFQYKGEVDFKYIINYCGKT